MAKPLIIKGGLQSIFLFVEGIDQISDVGGYLRPYILAARGGQAADDVADGQSAHVGLRVDHSGGSYAECLRVKALTETQGYAVADKHFRYFGAAAEAVQYPVGAWAQLFFQSEDGLMAFHIMDYERFAYALGYHGLTSECCELQPAGRSPRCVESGLTYGYYLFQTGYLLQAPQLRFEFILGGGQVPRVQPGRIKLLWQQGCQRGGEAEYAGRVWSATVGMQVENHGTGS